MRAIKTIEWEFFKKTGSLTSTSLDAFSNICLEIIKKNICRVCQPKMNVGNLYGRDEIWTKLLRIQLEYLKKHNQLNNRPKIKHTHDKVRNFYD